MTTLTTRSSDLTEADVTRFAESYAAAFEIANAPRVVKAALKMLPSWYNAGMTVAILHALFDGLRRDRGEKGPLKMHQLLFYARECGYLRRRKDPEPILTDVDRAVGKITFGILRRYRAGKMPSVELAGCFKVLVDLYGFDPDEGEGISFWKDYRILTEKPTRAGPARQPLWSVVRREMCLIIRECREKSKKLAYEMPDVSADDVLRYKKNFWPKKNEVEDTVSLPFEPPEAKPAYQLPPGTGPLTGDSIPF